MQKRTGVVFVSRRNTLRSILAEACLLHLDRERRFAAYSCGQPGQVGRMVHPAAASALASAAIALPPSPPRSWDDLVRLSSLRPDFVITLEPSVEGLEPRWPGQPATAEWAYPDIAAAEADARDTAHSAILMLYSLRRRLELLVSLPMAGTDRSALHADVRDLAHLR
ncbi:protein tyrosine phosphatase [Variovorax sp. J22P271]|uniref:arsenate reductase/protein-tyrosine-phosphatase family protein n=1 Tax=Variovorax davisae TaxID=3053515 RepID=UPI002577020E|nr:protein tyrosine phosphatase [Variovorax sp. J22P271]MDM0035761.1 protein tyrosine phosphatase [Variovorax sp. J22P271]